MKWAGYNDVVIITHTHWENEKERGGGGRETGVERGTGTESEDLSRCLAKRSRTEQKPGAKIESTEV